MNVAVREPKADNAAPAKLGIVDCDIHPSMKTKTDINKYLSARWARHWDTYGGHLKQAYTGSMAYPRMAPDTARGDAWPPNGGPPGSDLDFMRKQHLDANNIEVGVLHPLRIGGYDERNMEFSAALSTAINDWQLDAWVEPEPRLRASLYVPQDYPEAAVKEIERRAGDPRFVQVSCAPQSEAPLGNRRYWPMFAAICEANRPLALHIGGIPGHPPSGTGWPSYYFEHHFSNVPSSLSLITSLVFEGVFEQFPKLRVLLVETGFAWAPALCWRMDQHWERMRDEVPHVKRRPSEYVREHVWYSTQPMDEPERPEQLRDVIDWVGWDRVCFATDYPHWDFDDPAFAFKCKLTREERERIFSGNAKALFGLR
jgi:predicted TIM-barrel fold metal-dependent hydrolase